MECTISSMIYTYREHVCNNVLVCMYTNPLQMHKLCKTGTCITIRSGMYVTLQIIRKRRNCVYPAQACSNVWDCMYTRKFVTHADYGNQASICTYVRVCACTRKFIANAETMWIRHMYVQTFYYVCTHTWMYHTYRTAWAQRIISLVPHVNDAHACTNVLVRMYTHAHMQNGLSTAQYELDNLTEGQVSTLDLIDEVSHVLYIYVYIYVYICIYVSMY